MHGAYGEDGSLMGLLRMSGVPFVGCDMDASVIAMDKVLAKQVVQSGGLNTPKFVSFSKSDFESDKESILNNILSSLKFPQFVKPAHLGSSIGITKVSNKNELVNAIEVAAYYDSKILVEEGVDNLIEVTVPIIGNEIMTPAFVERPLSQDNNFFDFETKYMRGGKKGGGKKMAGSQGSQGYSELPAKLPGNMYLESIKLAEDVYRLTGCEGIARVDLLIDSKSEIIYFNEINPLPGSLYNHNWRASGISPIELVEKLIDLAEARFNRDKKIETTFSSSFLKQF